MADERRALRTTQTERRSAIRVLLRGLPRSSAAEVLIEGITVHVGGAAMPDSWTGVALEDGDLEGIIWTNEARVRAVLDALRGSPCVVVAIGADRTSWRAQAG